MAPKRMSVLNLRPAERGGLPVSLADFALFRDLTDTELRKVARRIQEMRYPKGAAIFRRNDPNEFLYALREGLVKLVARTGKGTGTILYILRPAEIFGELLLSEERRPFTAVALTDVLAAALSREYLVGLLSSIPALRLNFIRILSGRLAHVENGVSDFSHTWSYHRLAKVLLHLGEEFGEETPGGVMIRPTLTHTDLANMIGTTRETVTNQLSRFRRMGLIDARGRRLVVFRDRLSEFVRSEEPKGEGEWPALDKSA